MIWLHDPGILKRPAGEILIEAEPVAPRVGEVAPEHDTRQRVDRISRHAYAEQLLTGDNDVRYPESQWCRPRRGGPGSNGQVRCVPRCPAS